MPTYAYHCETCGKDFETVQRMVEPALETCECGEKGQVRRLLSTGAGVIFKGSGFYETDYKKSSASSSSGSAKSETKSESKSDKSAGESKKTEKKSDS